MELGRLTVQDCIDMYEKKGKEFMIGNGKVINSTVRKEKSYGIPVKVGHADKDNPG